MLETKDDRNGMFKIRFWENFVICIVTELLAPFFGGFISKFAFYANSRISFEIFR